MSSAARRAAGIATGALHGSYPDPGLGLVPLASVARWDDFVAGPAEVVANRVGDLLWSATTIGGSAATPSAVVPAQATEMGITQWDTAAAANTGSVVARTATTWYRAPAVGTIWAVKLKVVAGTTADYEVWSGFAQNAARVRDADANDFVGVRAVAGGNFFGVVKAGANQSTIDLQTDAQATWKVFGFEVLAGGLVQFFRMNASAIGGVNRTDVGAPLPVTHTPTNPLREVAVGLVATAAAVKQVQLDFWATGGRTAR